jgi:hypothetical protein
VIPRHLIAWLPDDPRGIERFVIIVTSLHCSYLPSSWGYFDPTIIDILTFVGTFGLFFTLFLLFARFLPMVALSEVKGVLADQKHRGVHVAEPVGVAGD